MVKDARNYTLGLKNYLTNVFGKDLIIEEVFDPYISFGIESVVHARNEVSGADFYAGFDTHPSGKASSRLRFFLQLSSPRDKDLMKPISGESREKKKVSKNLGSTKERFNPDADIYSVFCSIRDPDHIKPEDLYNDLLNYFLKANLPAVRK